MDELKIFWTDTAKRQRDHIFEYWNERNKSTNYSKKLNLSLEERTQLLKTQPEMGKKSEFENTRMISMGHYSILYKFILSKIIITGFWDNREDPKKLLNFLLRK
jgi:plasmid stabilization system protein ParE